VGRQELAGSEVSRRTVDMFHDEDGQTLGLGLGKKGRAFFGTPARRRRDVVWCGRPSSTTATYTGRCARQRANEGWSGKGSWATRATQRRWPKCWHQHPSRAFVWVRVHARRQRRKRAARRGQAKLMASPSRPGGTNASALACVRMTVDSV
jgi:hypothetical protein